MIRLLSCFILAVLSPLSITLAEGLPVQEVQTSIHEKAVTGYRVLLGRSVLTVREGIQSHLSDFGEKALDFEGVLIYENIAYPPITSARPVTLYYFVKNIEDLMTEITLVGIYDYQQIITAEHTPDLALRMLLDFSELTKGVTGDSLAFDPIFNRTSVTDLLAKYEDRKARTTLDFFVEQQQDRIAAGPDMLVRNDPFSKKRPDNFDTDDKIVAEMSTRFRNYTTRSGDNTSPFLKPGTAKRVAILEDSLHNVQDQLALLSQDRDALKLAVESQASLPQDTVFVHDTVTMFAEVEPDVKTETGGDVEMSEADELAYARELIKQYEDEIHSLTVWGDSLLALVPENGSSEVARVATLSADNSDALQAQIDELTEENESLRSSLDAQIEASQTVERELAEVQDLRAQIAELTTGNQALTDSLQAMVEESKTPAFDTTDLKQSIADLTAETSRLQSELEASQALADTLVAKEATEQVLLQQIAELEAEKEALAAEKDALTSSLTEIETALSEAQGEQSNLSSLQEETAELRKRNEDLQSKLNTRIEENKAQKAKLADSEALQTRLQELSKQNEQLNEQVANSTTENNDALRLRQENEKITADLDRLLAEYETASNKLKELQGQEIVAARAERSMREMQDSLEYIKQEREVILRIRKQKTMALVAANERTDSLSGLVGGLKFAEKRLQRERDSIFTELMLLNPESEMAKARRAVYRNQLERLVASQQSQQVKENELSRREKLVEQRERYLADFEAKGETQILLTRILELEAKLMLLEEESRAKRIKVPINRIRISSANLASSEGSIPAFQINTRATRAFTEEQIAAWFRLRGIKAVWDNPLHFDNALIPELGELLYQIHFQVWEDGTTLCSVQKPDTGYISADDEDGKKVEAFLQQIFR
ncbi:MAG: hypothetical protein AAF206_01395 [Bacteroidota bacterium]